MQTNIAEWCGCFVLCLSVLLRTYAVGVLSLRQSGSLRFSALLFCPRRGQNSRAEKNKVPCCSRQMNALLGHCVSHITISVFALAEHKNGNNQATLEQIG